MDTQEQTLLTLPEAAKLLRLKVSTLRAWRLQRKIPFRKIGGRILMHRDDIARLIEQANVPAVARG